MSTHMQEFQSFFRFFASLRIGHIGYQQHKSLSSSGLALIDSTTPSVCEESSGLPLVEGGRQQKWQVLVVY